VNERLDRIEDALSRLKVDRFDERAWAELYAGVVPRARAIAFRVLAGDAASSQDAVHDALIRLMRYSSFERFASCDDFIRYFTMMVHHAAIDTLQRHRADPSGSATGSLSATAPDEADTELADKTADEESSPEAAFSFKRAVENLSKSLSPRELLVCTLLAGGYERRELAARLGTSESTAAVIIFRLRAKLRELGHQLGGST